MELIDSLSSITEMVPKLVEFPKHFILNTQMYDKQTLKPIPMKFYVDNQKVPFMLLQTSIDKTNYHYGSDSGNQFQCIQNNNEHNKQCIIQDKNDPNIFYIIKQSATSSSYDSQAIFKMQYNENTKKYSTLNSFFTTQAQAPSDYHHKGEINILYENDEYFVLNLITQHANYWTGYRGYIDSLYTGIALLNKKTFAYTRLYNSYNSFGSFLLKAENDTVYILTTADDNSVKRVIKVNTSSKTCTTIWTSSFASKIGVSCNPVQIGDYYYVLTSYLENTLYSYKIMKMSLDTITDTVNVELLDINFNEYILDNSTNQNMSYSYYINYTLRLMQTSTGTYFSLLMHTVPNMATSYNYQCKHVLLKMNNSTSNTSFDVVDVIQLRDGCYGSLENGDSKHQVWYISNCALFYAFDETKEKMICTYKKPGAFMQIGFDSLNRFIVQTKDKAIEILTDTNACTLQADFAEELYDKDSASQVDTTVSFYAKNFSDEFLEVSVKLTLVGPVVFKENNSKELIVSTFKTGMRTVPVTITGYGNIQVIITQNT